MKLYEQTRLKISYLSRLYQTRIDALILEHGVSGAQSLILDVIYYQKECSQKYIADYLQVSTAAITKSIKALEQKELITKKQAPDDLRANNIALTKKGIAITQQIIKIIEQLDNRVFSSLESKQLLELNENIDFIIDNLNVDTRNSDYKKTEFENLYAKYEGENK